MRVKLLAAVLLLATATFSVTTAFADDFAPPPWRGGPNYTIQGWEFLDAGNPIPGAAGFTKVADDPGVPQVWGNGAVPFVSPIPGIGSSTPFPLATWTDGMTWDPGADGDGGWTGGTGTSMALWIPNWIDNEPTKFLRIQFTYDGAPPLIGAFGPIVGGFGSDPLTTVPGIPNAPVIVDARHYYQDWTILPNPHWERIVFPVPVGTRIDEIVVDTISFRVPEPGTFVLLIVAGLVAIPRRRR